MYTYFLTSSKCDLHKIKTENDILSIITNDSVQIGGHYSHERIDYLSTVFLGEQRESSPTDYELSDGSMLYQFDHDLTKNIAATGHEKLLDASVPWDEGAWQGTNVNRFDLAGFLVGLAEMCRVALSRQHEVYFVITPKLNQR